MVTNRRDFFKLLGLLGLGARLGSGRIALANQAEAIDLGQPGWTGTLPPIGKNLLWSAFEYIGQTWDNGRHCILTRTDFDAIVDLKTGERPSYLAEYVAFTAKLERELQGKDRKQALRLVFFDNGDPRLKKFVVAELIELQLAYGGFRMLGWKNFKGFQGGPFSNPANPPYRKAAK